MSTEKGAEYSAWSNIKYAMRLHWRARPLTLICCVISVLVGVGLPFVSILMPKIVIDNITAGVTPGNFILSVGAMALLLALLSSAKSYADLITNESVGTISILKHLQTTMHKHLHMDFEVLESPGYAKLGEKAWRAMQSNHSPASNVPRNISQLVMNVLGFLTYGMVIVTVHPLIILFLAVSAGINWLALSRARKIELATREERSKLHGKLWYIQKVSKESSGGKDIRLYDLGSLINGIFQNVLATSTKKEREVATGDMKAQLSDAALSLLRDGAAYAFLIYLLLNDKMTLGNFVLVFAAIGAFSGWLSGILRSSSELMRALSEMSDIRVYLDVPDISNTGAGNALPSGEMLPPAITLRNVGYTYPEATKPTLNGIDLAIMPGERIAIVGGNGAGKTTFIKLICGLYKPTTGEITLGGVDITRYNRDEFYSLFSTVFQDIHLFCCDIAGNISQQSPEKTDYEKVKKCLEIAGLMDKVNGLEKKESTLLVRRVHNDAIELSGGEQQKLALARALYKDAPVIILDEPTAALDPIAESEIYQRYAELTAGKTSIYISHRLASTRFCDRILFIEGGVIAECGSHDELMRHCGKYAEMFNVQSHYYKDGEVSENEDALHLA
ncbi:ABC transporter ATP-binding protein [Paenibacillus sp. CF384]|uniref:ABC transporter ATP-binding protein n=1 Tax=Paenibacillus sp. CF384 TaxID=1884382 RepID=UPI00089722BD|nr:ABC transporter ATP-binding protein [Paenibacillus sp. CF384]SDX04613.1 ATP-binding cassette, subfamily B/ATP-binding cassette, subfamily C [Paenibacillus sp. CF384]